MIAAPALTVRRFSTHYRVLAGHPRPQELRRELDDAVAPAVPAALAGALEAVLDPGDPSVWLVRRLEISLTLRTGAAPDVAALAWAAALAGALERAMRHEDGVEVIRFASPAEHVARFVAEAVGGTAWDRWYFRDFAGLRHLPVSAAVATAISRDSEEGLDALAALPVTVLAGVLAAVSPADARRTVAILAAGSPAPSAGLVARVAEAALGERTAAHDANGLGRLALALAVAVRRAEASAGATAVVRAARAVAALARAGETGGRAAAMARRALDRGDAVALRAVVGEDDEATLAAVLAAADGPVRALVTGGAGGVTERPPGAPPGRRATRFGGLFLLLPALDALRIEELLRAWPACGDATAAVAARALVAASALGGARAVAALADPVVRDVLSLPAAIGTPDLVAWRRELGRRAATALREATVARELRAGALDALLLTSAGRRGAPVAILSEAATGAWLAARGYRPGQATPAVVALLAPLAGAGARIAADDAELGIAAREILPEIACHPGNAGPAAADDLAHLAFAPAMRGPRELDLAFAVLGQRVLRAFARGLPGQARASLQHLRVNLLDVTAVVCEEDDRRCVQIAPAPLDVLLRMTGRTRARYTASWLDERPVALFPEER